MLLALLLLAIPPVRFVENEEVIEDTGKPNDVHTLEIHILPATFRFKTVSAGEVVLIDVKNTATSGYSELTVDGKTYRRQPVQAGTHSVTLSSNMTNKEPVLVTVLTRLSPASIRSRLLRTRPPTPPLRAVIELTLNPTGK